MRLQKVLALVALTVLVACSQPLPTQPTNVNVFNQNTQNQGANQNTGGSTAPGACAGLAAAVNLSTTGGTVSGGHPRVGEVWFLALDVTALGGGQLPPNCLSSAPEVSVIGPCKTDGFSQSLGKIQVLPTAIGVCTVKARFDGKDDSVTADVVA